jgi:phage terminase large subunit-like protein
MAERSSERVRKIIRFIEKLNVPSGKGEGKPFKLRPFQKKFIRDVYGQVGKMGNRQIRRAILSLARKNGKTALIATLALVHLIGPEAITNGEIYSAANDRDQAAIVFKYAAQIVRGTPELLEYVKIVDSTKTMICFLNGSIYRAVSAEAGTKYGLNPTVVIYDELAQAKNRELYDALDTSMAARAEPLYIVISTQSNDPQHILSQLIDDGLSGHDPTTVCHLYAVPDDADDEGIYADKKLWKLANPALGDFRSLAEMKTAANRAKRMPSFESSFRNLYLNQRVDAKSPLIPRAEWLACKQDQTWIEKGAEIYLGLDLSGRTDLTALVAVTANSGLDIVKAWFWKPRDTLREHEKRDRVPYFTWSQQGYIETTAGRAIQYEFVAEKLAEIVRDYTVLGMAYDRWRIDDLLKEMRRIGLDGFVDGKDEPMAGALRLVQWGQGYKDMAGAVDAMEVSILERNLKHDGNPVLTWNMSNAIGLTDPAGNRKIDKSATRFRIDGAVALAMALGLKSKDMAKPEEPSIYETRGVLTFGQIA